MVERILEEAENSELGMFTFTFRVCVCLAVNLVDVYVYVRPIICPVCPTPFVSNLVSFFPGTTRYCLRTILSSSYRHECLFWCSLLFMSDALTSKHSRIFHWI